MAVSKLDAARVQLDRAIECFFDSDHICAVTLGGAAEDILAGLLTASGDQSPFQFLHDWYQKTYNIAVSAKDFSHKIANPARNWLKHAKNDPDSNYEVTEKESILMLMRAVPCYHKITKKHTVQMERFFQYVQINIDNINELFS